MASARADDRVSLVARTLHRSKQSTLLTFLLAAFQPLDVDRQAAAYVDLFDDDQDKDAVRQVAAVLKEWKAELDRVELGKRKGAVVESLVEMLLVDRLTRPNVTAETRVEFTSGERTSPVDVLGTPPSDVWESYEVKAGFTIETDVALELNRRLRLSAENGNELLVAVASTAARESLIPSLRVIARYAELVFVSVETLFTLAATRPVETVPTPA